MINEKKLELYLDNNLNVLLEGAHGVGKTAVIKKVFESKGLKWKYFSAATMDPWVDFIGVPKSVVDKDGTEVLELVKPKEFAYDEVEAIFFDEFNRAPSKVMNAVMELIQFKSINGKKFNNLKVIWAAINPYDEENTYKVEEIDPATIDRFHIKINVPYELDTGYLYKEYGQEAKPFINWWNELPQDLKTKISPRRLDYAIKIFSVGGDLQDVLIKESNVKKLLSMIKENASNVALEKISKKTPEELKSFFTMENTLKYAESVVTEHFGKDLVKYFNPEYIEQKIQQTGADKVKSFLINKAIDDVSFYNELSKQGKEVIDLVVEKRKEVKQHSMSDKAYNELEKCIRQNIKFSSKTFIERIYPTFVTYLKEIKRENNTDIPSYFEALFSVKDETGKELKDDIFRVLGQPFKAMSQSLPDEKYYLFAGMLYNFAQKFAKDVFSNHESGLQEFVKNVYAVSFKNRASAGNRSAEGFIFSYNEDNWPIVQNITSRNLSIKSTTEYKDFCDKHRRGESNIFTINNPGTLEDAKEIFCKTNSLLDAINSVQGTKQISRRKKVNP